VKVRRLEELSRTELAALGREWMLYGHTYDRALMPQVGMRLGGGKEIEPLSIWEWKGASPNYTRRMKRLMKIEGEGADAIVKALQLDVGFPHEYMDVQFEVHDAQHAEFRLLHCGALMDVEKRGEAAVVMMCHRIEDPTFDATAVATNPRARMRPIHRPPRQPADRHPHCHWTITIEPGAEPLVEEPHTLEVGRLALARVPNAMPADREPGGWRDYAGPVDPRFQLEQLSQGALVAVLREFSLQAHLLASSASLFLEQRHERAKVREVLANQWAGANWVTAERIAARLGAAERSRARVEGLDAAPEPRPAQRGEAERSRDLIAEVLALHPALPPGLDVAIEPAGERALRLALSGPPELLDTEAPGWLGLLAAGEPRPIEAIAQAVDPRARVSAGPGHAFAIEVDPAAEPAAEPQSAALTKLSTVAAWRFREFA
jgi:hypothetical protein